MDIAYQGSISSQKLKQKTNKLYIYLRSCVQRRPEKKHGQEREKGYRRKTSAKNCSVKQRSRHTDNQKFLPLALVAS